MMQIGQSPSPPSHLDLAGGRGDKIPLHLTTRPWPCFTTSHTATSNSTAKSSLGSSSSTCSMEQLLVHCANAIEGNDSTLAQQLIWVLNNIAPPDGDSNQRLTAGFLRALVARASRTGSCNALAAVANSNRVLSLDPPCHLSAVEFASFIDLTPWHRFGYSASNIAIADAVDGFSAVHIVDLSTTHCMQMPTLIDTLASRPEGPHMIRLTVPGPCHNSPPPALDMSYDELGKKLVKFAQSRNIAMEFRVVESSPSNGFNNLIEHVRMRRVVAEGEALVINCQLMLHCIPEDCISSLSGSSPHQYHISLRSMILKAIRSLDPTLVTVVDEDVDLTANDFVARLRSAFSYMWIPYDAADALLPKGSEQRRWHEAGVGWKIENVIARHGLQRVERQETRVKWMQRMRAAGFRTAAFGEEATAEVKGMLDEHAAGWGIKREEDDALVLTWKGHNVVFASAWAPC